jgi:hypothetical protein
MEDVGIFCGQLVNFPAFLVNFVVVWYIFSLLVCYGEKNLATLPTSCRESMKDWAHKLGACKKYRFASPKDV